MCKASLQADGTGTWGVNEFVEQSIKRLFPVDLMERQTGFEEEQLNEANIPSEEKFEIVYTFFNGKFFMTHLSIPSFCLHDQLPQGPLSSPCFRAEAPTHDKV